MHADGCSRGAAAQTTGDPLQNTPAAYPALENAGALADEVVLVVIEGEALGKRVPIGHAPVIVGRGVGVDLQVRDLTVSRHHCVVWRASGSCWVRDLGSTNQTRVNNRPTFVTELFDGDVVVMGQTTCTLAMSRHRREENSRAAGKAARNG